jgi:hypothetical protein
MTDTLLENVFIWNSWPILYGGFGALLSAVQMGQVGQMLNQNNFPGGLENIEGSISETAQGVLDAAGNPVESRQSRGCSWSSLRNRGHCLCLASMGY